MNGTGAQSLRRMSCSGSPDVQTLPSGNSWNTLQMQVLDGLFGLRVPSVTYEADVFVLQHAAPHNLTISREDFLKSRSNWPMKSRHSSSFPSSLLALSTPLPLDDAVPSGFPPDCLLAGIRHRTLRRVREILHASRHALFNSTIRFIRRPQSMKCAHLPHRTHIQPRHGKILKNLLSSPPTTNIMKSPCSRELCVVRLRGVAYPSDTS